MKALTEQEKKDVALNILLDIDVFCRKNNIRYSLFGGSLLGAVRHKGFIPWDDDIDICMPRPDYERFIRGYEGANPNYVVSSFVTDNVCHSRFAKVYDNRTVYHHVKRSYGLYVDIFPIDGVPDNCEKSFFDTFNHKCDLIIRKRHCFKQTTRPILGFFKYIVKQIMTPRSRFALLGDFYDYMNKYRFGETRSAASITNPVYGWEREIVDTSVFLKYIDMPFEGYNIKCIENYHAYLSSIYGDYMTPPPVEKRVPRHSCPTFWKE
ncbi:MAG: LicD family protein [Bacteroidales bacterium]|nr:LicD family protein [Bacteroidales bacterium]